MHFILETVSERIYATVLYVLISIITIGTGFILFNYFDALTYKIVTIFIGLIILSNCSAKLYTLHVYKEIP